MLMLKATEYQENTDDSASWQRRTWEIEADGWYRYTEYAAAGCPESEGFPSLEKEDSLTEEQLRKLTEAMAEPWPEEEPEEPCGSEWEFECFADETAVKQWSNGKISGTEPFETIAGILA